jgi:hypothetical protein
MVVDITKKGKKYPYSEQQGPTIDSISSVSGKQIINSKSKGQLTRPVGITRSSIIFLQLLAASAEELILKNYSSAHSIQTRSCSSRCSRGTSRNAAGTAVIGGFSTPSLGRTTLTSISRAMWIADCASMIRAAGSVGRERDISPLDFHEAILKRTWICDYCIG